MRFGHGSQSRGSSCVMVVLLISATVNFPGGPLSIAQETSGKVDNFTESFTAENALRKIEAAGHNPSEARQLLQDRILKGHDGARLESNNEFGPSARLQDDQLYVEGSRDYINLVKQQLIHVEEFGLSQMLYAMLVVEVPTEEARAIVEKWNLAGGSMTIKQEAKCGLFRKNIVVPASFSDSATTFEIRVSDVLNDEQINELVGLGMVIDSRKIVGQNGAEVNMRVGREVPFVAAYERVKDENGTATVQLKVGNLHDGIKLDLTGVFDDKKQNVQLGFRLTHSHLKEMKTLAYESKDGPLTVQQPDFTSSGIQTTCNAPTNKTIGLCSGPIIRESVVEQGVPLIGRVPYVGKVFKNSRKKTESITIIILIRCQEHKAINP